MERRVIILFRVQPGEVTVLRIIYAGREFDTDDVPD